VTSHTLRAAAAVAVRMHVLLRGAAAVELGAKGQRSMEHVQRQPGRRPPSQVSCSNGASHTPTQLLAPTHQQLWRSVLALYGGRIQPDH
jgi:hypothetical protein